MPLPGAIGPSHNLSSRKKRSTIPPKDERGTPGGEVYDANAAMSSSPPSAGKRKRAERDEVALDGQGPTPPHTNQPVNKKSTPQKMASRARTGSTSSTAVMMGLLQDPAVPPETKESLRISLEAVAAKRPPKWKGAAPRASGSRALTPFPDIPASPIIATHPREFSLANRNRPQPQTPGVDSAHPDPATPTPTGALPQPAAEDISDPLANADNDAGLTSRDAPMADNSSNSGTLEDEAEFEAGQDIFGLHDEAEGEVAQNRVQEYISEQYRPIGSANRFPGSNPTAALCIKGGMPDLPSGFNVPESVREFYDNKSAMKRKEALGNAYATIKDDFDQRWSISWDARLAHLMDKNATQQEIDRELTQRTDAKKVLMGIRAPTAAEAYWIAKKFILPLCGRSTAHIDQKRVDIFLQGLRHLNQHSGPGVEYALLSAHEIATHMTSFFHSTRDFTSFVRFPQPPQLPQVWDWAGELHTNSPPGDISKQCTNAILRGDPLPDYGPKFVAKKGRAKGDKVKMRLTGGLYSIGWVFGDEGSTLLSEHFWTPYRDLYARQYKLLIEADTHMARDVSRYNIEMMYACIHNAIVGAYKRESGQVLSEKEKSCIRNMDTWREMGMIQARYRVFLSYIHCRNHLVMSEEKGEAISVQRALEKTQAELSVGAIRGEMMKIAETRR